MGMVIGLKTGKVEEYKRLHADVWPSGVKTLSDAKIRNYSILAMSEKRVVSGLF
jgi:L-rhamnose mutarotase